MGVYISNGITLYTLAMGIGAATILKHTACQYQH